MRWATQVSQAQIRRLYHLFKSGIYDDELLLQVGWGLHARCKDVLTVVRAVRGEVPCPECGRAVYRSKYQYYSKLKEHPPSAERFSCPACKARPTWQDCKEELRNHPRCFACRSPLERDYTENRLACTRCGKAWSWQQYLASIRRRTWLPCPRCSALVRRPSGTRQDAEGSTSKSRVRAVSEEARCPRCQASARHAEGKIRCVECGYEQRWAIYRKRMKRRVERLRCLGCGHEFTWSTWRRWYQGLPLFTGNPGPVEDFLKKWPRCRTRERQLIQIDTLLRALHGQGAMAPLFVEGDSDSVMTLLNELAQQR